MLELFGWFGTIKNFLSPFFSLFGATGALVILGALAFAWFSPVFKKTALWVALGAALTLGAYAHGAHVEGARVRAEWDAANERARIAAEQRDKDIRADAERAVEAALKAEKDRADEAERKAVDFESERAKLTRGVCRLDLPTIGRMPPTR